MIISKNSGKCLSDLTELCCNVIVISCNGNDILTRVHIFRNTTRISSLTIGPLEVWQLIILVHKLYCRIHL